jgi:hypothetical protein
MPTEPLDRVSDDLGADRHALLRRHGVRVRAVEPVPGIDSPSPSRRALHVELDARRTGMQGEQLALHG